MNRIAIILEKNLEIGAASNVSAILMGQAARLDSEIYADIPVLDQNNNRHAGIKYSTVILKAGEGQILNLIQNLKSEESKLKYVVFSKTGQSLNNAFDQYAQQISTLTTEESKILGVIVWGEDELVRAATKKYSVFK